MYRARVWRFLSVTLLACILVGSLIGTPLLGSTPLAHALSSSLVVTSTSDSGGGTCPGSTCTLRTALTSIAPGGTITFSLASGSTIDLGSTLLVNQSVTIQGPGAAALTIEGGSYFRVFSVYNGPVTISGLTISGGYYNDGSYTDNSSGGGGIYNTAALTLTNDLVTLNSAAENLGGGVYNDTAGTLALVGTTLYNNTASYGGGLYNDGIVSLDNTTVISDNLAVNGQYEGQDSGGGIYNDVHGTLSSNGATIDNNFTDALGGGIYNEHLITLANTTVISGNAAYGDGNSDFGGGIFNDQDATIAITGTTVAGNLTDNEGGGLYNLGTAQVGAGSTFNGNSVDATYNDDPVEGNTGGGAIWNDATIAISGTTLENNSVYDPYYDDSAYGGGIAGNYGDSIDVPAQTIISNTTIVSNTVGGIIPQVVA